MDGDTSDPRLSPQERAAVAFAGQFWHDHHAVDATLWRELNAVFTPEELIELGMSVAQYIGMGKLIAMLGIPAPQFRDD